MRLNLGSGSRPVHGYVNVDIADIPGVDVVYDLDVTPWPWEDGTVLEIVGQDIFEHVANPVGFMMQAHRVLKEGGSLLLKVPHFRHQDAFTDPTHRRFCTEHTWDYWIEGTQLFTDHNAAYGGVRFRLERRAVASGSIFIHLHKI